MLNFNPAWRFSSPGPIASGVEGEFNALIGRIVAQVDRQKGLEHFKHYFANAAGFTSNWSSNAGWAEFDLYRYMQDAAANAPLFIEAFYDACMAYHVKGIGIPDISSNQFGSRQAQRWISNSRPGFSCKWRSAHGPRPRARTLSG